MRRELFMAFGAALIAGAMLYAGSGHDYADAYIFPNLIAWIMLGLALVMIVALIAQPSAAVDESGGSIEWARLMPVLVILPVYVLVAESLGFIVSALLAFFAIGRVYALDKPGENTTLRYLMISVCFIAVLYLIFVILLQVQMPSGLLV